MWDHLVVEKAKHKKLQGCYQKEEIDRFMVYTCPFHSFLQIGASRLRQKNKNFYAFKFEIPEKNNAEVGNIRMEWRIKDKDHTFYLMGIMYAYFFVALFASIRYLQKIKNF
jgi:hypothetical protein